ncbi:EF-hand domain-containing protein [Plasmodiophora brassicae]|nr:hypothetical protein PBRA_008283 [Plasmodiophora brassicae]
MYARTAPDHVSGKRGVRRHSSIDIAPIGNLQKHEVLIAKQIYDDALPIGATYLNRRSLPRAVRALIVPSAQLPDQCLDYIASGFDSSRSGSVPFVDFARRVSDVFRGSRSDRQKMAFDMMDTNGRGVLRSSDVVALAADQYAAAVFAQDLDTLLDVAIATGTVSLDDASRVWNVPAVFRLFVASLDNAAVPQRSAESAAVADDVPLWPPAGLKNLTDHERRY